MFRSIQFNFYFGSIGFLYSFNLVSIFIQFSFYIHSIQLLYSFNSIRLYSFNPSSHIFNFWVEGKFEGGAGTHSKDGGGNERLFDTTVHVVYSALVNVKDVIIDVIIIIIIIIIIIVIIILIIILLIIKIIIIIIKRLQCSLLFGGT